MAGLDYQDKVCNWTAEQNYFAASPCLAICTYTLIHTFTDMCYSHHTFQDITEQKKRKKERLTSYILMRNFKEL